MSRISQTAYATGQRSALAAYGLEKEAGVGQWLGRAGKWGARALGVLPTGMGNAASGILGAITGGISNAAQAGPGMWNKVKAYAAGAIPGMSAAIPGGVGVAASVGADMAQNKINNAVGVKPAGASGPEQAPMMGTMGGMRQLNPAGALA